MTNVGIDVADWYKIDWTNEEKTEYLLDGNIAKANVVIEKYRVKGSEEMVYDTVRWTHWGPVVYESEKSNWKNLALRWLSHDEPNPDDILAFLPDLIRGKNYNDYRRGISQIIPIPAQNFVYADKKGDIAITVNGRFPIKKQGQGPFVQNGNYH